MRLTFAVALAFTVCSTLVSGHAIIARSLPPSCGGGGTVLEQSSVEYNGATIGTYAKLETVRATPTPKQTPGVLSDQQQLTLNLGSGSIGCENLSTSSINPTDCGSVIGYLESLSRKLPILMFHLLPLFELTALPQQPFSFGRSASTFSLDAQSYAYWYYGTCEITIVNADTIPYTVCYYELGVNSGLAAETCLGTTAGAVCVGTQDPGQMFEIAVL
ncbi:hypothetical protein F5148DRAFT_1280123 [Russula earlei]|uniref:Uncharacterized protein n=1 Tax=Russula earlei TaxID=71964 RepID=A0ACC0UKH1_9AGAM|nr:hypothetical protein F5148DRAFT_1280123 [Russula earlei]